MINMNIFKHMKKIGLALLFISGLFTTVQAREDLSVGRRTDQNNRNFIARLASTCTPPSAKINLDINNVRTMILRGNDMWWDLASNPRYEIPKLDDPSLPKKHSLFAGSVWVGGIDAVGTLKVAAQTYRQTTVLGVGWWAGPLTLDSATISKAECDRWDTHWKVERKQIQDHIAGIESGDPNYVVPDAIRNWPASGDVTLLQDPKLAPFVDVDADDIYNPSAGDYPFIYGDQSIWFVTNDKGNAPGSGGTPIGMEIQTQAFGYRSNDELNNMTFYSNKIINRSSITLNNCFMAQWVDPDLGQATDDFVGCDVPRGLGICYNGDDDDEGIQGYGVNPPSIGIDFFEGPFSDLNDGIDNDRDGTVDEIAATGCDPEPRTERIIMAKFLYFNNDGTPIGNPSTAEHAYNYMIGKWKDNSQMVYGGTGYPGSVGATTTPAGLMFPGASDRAYGWSIGGSVQNPIAPPFDWDENNPGPGAQANVPADRRFVQSAGPFTLVPGAVNYITIGVVWARASSGGARGSFNQLLRADSKAQALFDACFKTIDGPDAPDVSISELDQELILSFSYRPTSNNYNLGYREIDPVIQALNRDLPPGTPLYDSVYKFEGFKVYQLSASNVSTGELDDPSRARLLYQGDLNNGVSRIINWNYDLDMEQSVPFIAVDGANEGVRMTLRVTRDLFAEGSDRLVNFKRYYYLVVAYAYNQYQEFDPVALTGQQRPYLAGRNNVSAYTGIPHKWEPTFNGLILNSAYGDGPEITQLEGRGNGGRNLELTDETLVEILNNGYAVAPKFEKSFGPIDIKVIDPTLVPRAKMQLAMYKGTPSGTAAVDNSARWYILYNNDTIFSDTTIALANEQILGYYESTAIFRRLGLSATIRNVAPPGDAAVLETGNGLITSGYRFSEPSREWMFGLPDGFGLFDWIKAGPANVGGGDGFIVDGDPKRAYEGVVRMTIPGTDVQGGTWSPMRFAMPSAITPGVFVDDVPQATPFRLAARLDSLKSVDIVITPDKSKWTRCVVLEMCEASAEAQGGRRRNHIRDAASVDKDGNVDANESRRGLGWFPGYAISLETGVRLNIAFGEDSRASLSNGRDMIWNPNDTLFGDVGRGQPQITMGGKHFIYVFGSRYDTANYVYNQLAGPGVNVNNLGNSLLRNVYREVLWTSIPLLSPGKRLLDNEVKFSIRVNNSYGKFLAPNVQAINAGNPRYEFDLTDLAPIKNDLPTAQKALDLIRVVPNPYYGASRYETSQIDNRVRITNLPIQCVIKIYTLNGTLIRTLRKDDASTFVDWDLLNQERIPIASGMYLLHVNAPGIGEKVVKWFGVTRPIDLDTF